MAPTMSSSATLSHDSTAHPASVPTLTSFDSRDSRESRPSTFRPFRNRTFQLGSKPSAEPKSRPTRPNSDNRLGSSSVSQAAYPLPLPPTRLYVPTPLPTQAEEYSVSTTTAQLPPPAPVSVPVAQPPAWNPAPYPTTPPRTHAQPAYNPVPYAQASSSFSQEYQAPITAIGPAAPQLYQLQPESGAQRYLSQPQASTTQRYQSLPESGAPRLQQARPATDSQIGAPPRHQWQSPQGGVGQSFSAHSADTLPLAAELLGSVQESTTSQQSPEQGVAQSGNQAAAHVPASYAPYRPPSPKRQNAYRYSWDETSEKIYPIKSDTFGALPGATAPAVQQQVSSTADFGSFQAYGLPQSGTHVTQPRLSSDAEIDSLRLYGLSQGSVRTNRPPSPTGITKVKVSSAPQPTVHVGVDAVDAHPASFEAWEEPTADDPRALVYIQDRSRGPPHRFSSPAQLTAFLRLYPQADNDQASRLIEYRPDVPSSLLMPLFEHLDFGRFSIFPYGFANNFAVEGDWGGGSCSCSLCMEGKACGHYVLQRNLRFYGQSGMSTASTTSPKIEVSNVGLSISTGLRKYEFQRSDWNLQIFRFRSRRMGPALFAQTALIYQNYMHTNKIRSSPLGYLFAQLDIVLEDWEALLSASAQFLAAFRLQVLEERLDHDRSIIRDLLIAAQNWEEFRQILKTQMERINMLEKVHDDGRWAEGYQNYFELVAVATGYLQRFRAVDFRITNELMSETDLLVQRISNLIAINEGYRSRDQNESIRRLTWVTFIFLPLIFTSAIFSMQIDLFTDAPPWQFTIYTALVVVALVFMMWAVMRIRRQKKFIWRKRQLLLLPLIPLLPVFWVLARLLRLSLQAWNRSRGPRNDLEGQNDAADSDSAQILKWAASSGHTDVIRNILKPNDGSNRMTIDAAGPALLMAIRNKHVEAASLLVSENQGLQYRDPQGQSPLHWAAKMRLADLCQLLLDHGLSPTLRDQEGDRALELAVRAGDNPTIRVLLNADQKLSHQNTVDLQGLHYSARIGDLPTVKALCSQGSSPEARDSKGQTVLFHAVKGERHEVMRWLLEEGRANVHAIDKEGLTPLHVAASVGNKTSVEILLERGANADASSIEQRRPAHCLADSHEAEILKLLCFNGADINAWDRTGQRVIHVAARQGTKAVPLFRQANELGADLSVCDFDGNTSAHLAAATGCREMLELIDSVGVDILSVRNNARYTPLMSAAQAAEVDIMRYLIGKGASFDVTDAQGLSLIELAVGWAQPSVIECLCASGAQVTGTPIDETAADETDGHTHTHNTTVGSSIDARAHPIWRAIRPESGFGVALTLSHVLDAGLSVEYSWRGIRLLQHAIEARHLGAVRTLLDRGARVDVADEVGGWTALHSAAHVGDPDILLLVLSRVADTTKTSSSPEPTDRNLDTSPDANGATANGATANGTDAASTAGLSTAGTAATNGANESTAAGVSTAASALASASAALAAARNPRDFQGWTPLDLAAFFHHTEAVALLDPQHLVKEYVWSKSAAQSVGLRASTCYEPTLVESVLDGRVEAPGDRRVSWA